MGFFARRRAAKEGVDARATVLRIESAGYVFTNVHGDLETDESRRVITRLHLRVHPPGGASYEVTIEGRQAEVVGAYARGEGTDIAVTIDPEDPGVVVIDEPEARAELDAELELLERIDAGGDVELPPESRWPEAD